MSLTDATSNGGDAATLQSRLQNLEQQGQFNGGGSFGYPRYQQNNNYQNGESFKFKLNQL